MPLKISRPGPDFVSPPMTLLPPAEANEPLIWVVPVPATVIPPEPGVPITVFVPITSVVPEPAAALLAIVNAADPEPVNSRLPVATLARLMVCVVATAGDTVIDVTLLRI